MPSLSGKRIIVGLIVVLVVTSVIPGIAAAAKVEPRIDAPDRAFVGERVTLDASGTELSTNFLDQLATDPQLEYQWEISGPDYIVERGERTTVTFDEAGTYNVELTVVVIAASSFLGGDIMRSTETTIEVLRPDPDGDGIDFRREQEIGTDPRSADTDGDGLDDGRELEMGLDPLSADTDGDGLSDGREVEEGTDPTAPDTDGDGLTDATELEQGTDPTSADTDGDGFEDKTELDRGFDPTDPDTDGDGVEDGQDPRPNDPSIPENGGDGSGGAAQNGGERGQENTLQSAEISSLLANDDVLTIGGALLVAIIILKVF